MDLSLMESAYAHRDLYDLNQFRSKLLLHEVLTILHDEIDHSTTTSRTSSPKVKHFDGLMKLSYAITEMLAHSHVDQQYAHYSLDIYSQWLVCLQRYFVTLKLHQI